jgi:hypothetical protein
VGFFHDLTLPKRTDSLTPERRPERTIPVGKLSCG